MSTEDLPEGVHHVILPETAASLWGLATNEALPQPHRLGAALQALEFYGSEYDRLMRVNEAYAAGAAAAADSLRGVEPTGSRVDEIAGFQEELPPVDLGTRVVLVLDPSREIWRVQTRSVLPNDGVVDYDLVSVGSPPRFRPKVRRDQFRTAEEVGL